MHGIFIWQECNANEEDEKNIENFINKIKRASFLGGSLFETVFAIRFVVSSKHQVRCHKK